MIEWFLYLVLELLPVPIPHGRILQVLNQRHRAFEGIDTFLQRVTHCPVNFVLRERGEGREGDRIERNEDGRILKSKLNSYSILYLIHS